MLEESTRTSSANDEEQLEAQFFETRGVFAYKEAVEVSNQLLHPVFRGLYSHQTVDDHVQRGRRGRRLR